MINDLLNFSSASLNLIDSRFHNGIENSFVDSFIHELQNYLKLKESNKILKNLSSNLDLHFAKFDSNFAVCFNYNKKAIFNIPKEYISGALPEIRRSCKV